MFWGLFFQGIACLGILIVSVLIISHIIIDYFKRFPKKASTAIFRTLSKDSRNEVVDMWASIVGGPYNSKINDNSFVVDKFFSMLQLNFKGEFCTRLCTDRNSCNTIYKITEGQKIALISVNYSEQLVVDHKGRDAFKANFDISEYAQNDKVSLAYGYELVSDLDYNDPFILNIQGLVKECEAERIFYFNETSATVTLYKLKFGAMGIRFDPFKLELPEFTTDYMDAAYSDAKVEYGGESHGLKMSKIFNLVKKTIAMGGNISIFGSPGSGKTTLLENLAASLTRGTERYKVLMVPANVVAALKSPDNVAALINEVAQEREMGYKVILIIDEAEMLLAKSENGVHSENNTFMLQLLDGTLKKELGVATVLVFNTKIENLNPALFRAMRMAMVPIYLTPLDEDRARNLVKQLKRSLPGKVFDSAKFESILKNENALTDGTVYANQGEISLADVYSCFLDQDFRAMLLSYIREEATSQTLQIKLPTKSPRKVLLKLAPLENLAIPTASSQAVAPVLAVKAESVSTAPKPVIPGKRRDRRRHKK